MYQLDALNFSPAVIEALTKTFPDEMIRRDLQNQRSDGFVPCYIQWTDITKRLDEVFGMNWSWEILNQRIEYGQYIVHGRLSVTVAAAIDEGHAHLIEVKKDGVGSCVIASDPQGRPVNIADDLKSACADALKRAAVLLRVGAQLYEREHVKKDVSQQAVVQAQTTQNQPALPFQIASVRNLLARYNYPEGQACQYLGVAKLEDLTSTAVMELLSGKHPLVIWLNQQYPQVAAQSPAAGALKAANA